MQNAHDYWTAECESAMKLAKSSLKNVERRCLFHSRSALRLVLTLAALSEQYNAALYRTGRHTLSAPLAPRLHHEPQYATHFQLKNLLQVAPDGRLVYATAEPSAIVALDPHTGEARQSMHIALSTQHTCHYAQTELTGGL